MIRVENLHKSYGDLILFEGLNFALNERERLGIVGRNGHGKTTLFRMILDKENPDSGSIIIPKNYRIGYVSQSLEFSNDTILSEAISALPETEKDHHWKAEKILAGLGFNPTEFQRHPKAFSGGYQVRLNLAKALISEPDLLLLDEPTNFLDITSIRWIEQFLQSWPHEVMLITHDRSFMDKIVTHTMGIHRLMVRKIEGHTAKYYDQIAVDEEVYENTRIKDERRRKEIQQFITRFRAKARQANLVQSRTKTLQKMEKKQKLEKLKILDFSFNSSPFQAKHVFGVQNLNFSYDRALPLIRDFNITVAAGERICVVGPNGKGKSTLLKLLSGEITPRTGEISYHPAVKKGLFEQGSVKTLVDRRSVLDEIVFSNPDGDLQQARNVCGAMMFSGDDALKKISVLSGGEKSRVMLGKLLVTPVNLLLLDEPTNHLDMESSDALLAAIDNFDGTVIMVTHNEMFLHALARRLIIFQNDRIEVFDGSYQRFLDKGGWQDENMTAGRYRQRNLNTDSSTKRTKKELRRQRSEIISERSRTVKPLQERIIKVENQMEKEEAELGRLNLSMQQAAQDQDGSRITEISQALHACQQTIDRLFAELEKLTRDLDTRNTEFETRLNKLDTETS
ncbi:MAG: ATP-binding cassette domain-containing protein [Desulfobacterales bacterium]|jgi:ATP-binding cassette subfamily F protein 3|nr:ATP-binding cassette domain-containing protein [Desulfobacterales bacterium]